MGTIFPLFTEQLYARLTYHWGTTLFAFIAVAMIPIPYVSTRMLCRASYLTWGVGYRCSCGKVLRFARIASSRRRSYINSSFSTWTSEVIYAIHFLNCNYLNLRQRDGPRRSVQ